MTIASHSLIGCLVAAAIREPIVALPAAFLSHFVADSVPHFGYPGHEGIGEGMKHEPTKIIGLLDPLILAGLITALIHFSAPWYVYLAGFLAVSPDLEWLAAYLFFERRDQKPWRSPIAAFHEKIQWCEQPWGYFVELAIMLAGFISLNHLLK